MRGNVVDPLDLIDMYGADALRFALTSGTSAGNDMRLNEHKMEASRNFANKLWNAARFVMSRLEGTDLPEDWDTPPRPYHLEDRWILSRLNHVIAQVNGFMEEYHFGEAQRVLHDFLWGEYCDWYLEMSKVRLRDGGTPSPLPVLAFVLERVLHLLHPFMPFITEEVWRTLTEILPRRKDTADALVVAAYPEADPTLYDDRAELEVAAVVDLVRGVRNIRTELRIDASRRIEAIVHTTGFRQALESEVDAIATLAQVAPLTFISDDDAPASDGAVSLVLTGGTVVLPLGGLIDLDQEKKRLATERGETEANRERLAARLRDESFLSKAPEEVVERERQRLSDVEGRLARLEDITSRLA